MSDLQTRLLAAFQVESRDYLEALRAVLARGRDAGSLGQKDREEALRRAHNLKGAARAVDLPGIELLAHRLEALFLEATPAALGAGGAAAAVIERALDSMEDWLDALARGQAPPEPAGARREIERLLGLEPEPEPERAEPIEPAPEGPAAAEDTLRVRGSVLDRLLRTSGEIQEEGRHLESLVRDMAAAERELEELEGRWRHARSDALAALRAQPPSQDRSRLESRLEAVEQQVKRLGSALRQTRRGQREHSARFGSLGRRLHADSRRVLMVPARSVFEGFPRMMRDLAAEERRPLEFRLSGADVEADRRVLQHLKDPLLHLLRNAVAHGIEPPEERRARGKPETARVELSLEARGSRLEVRVQDDGRGVDLRRVAAEAVRQGLMTEERARSAAAEELLAMLFRAGFSTSGKVDRLSGRGVGLSVVREAARRLQGEADLVPAEGGGTAVRLRVPLFLSTQILILVRAGGHVFALPAAGIERLERRPPADVRIVEGRPSVGPPDLPVPVVSLGYLLGLEDAGLVLSQRALCLAHLRSGSRRLAVAVECFLDRLEGLVRDAGLPARLAPAMAGATLLRDGSACAVLDPHHLVVRAAGCRPAIHRVEAEVPAPAAARRRRILVVDDSFTTRTLEKTVLESQGYQVLLAVDGAQALDVLRSEEVDLVVSDIQMPRLDGFALVRALKADPRLASLPVVLLTSKATPEDRERGLELGAEAYLIKQRFDQGDLLETVRQLL